MDSSWLICESLKTLEIKILIVFSLVFVNKTISLCVFLFFLVIILYFLIFALIAEIYFPTTGLVIPTWTLTNEENVKSKDIQWQQKGKQENALSNIKPHTLFYAFHSSTRYVLSPLKDNFLFPVLF